MIPAERCDLRRMQEMFHDIAPRYDFITRTFSYGMDKKWKRDAVERTPLPPGSVILDLACGTGDFSRLAEARSARAISADLTFRMLAASSLDEPVCADAMQLPFASRSFDAVFIGYGMRNFPNLKGAVAEIRRVLKPGGTLATLDFFLPRNPLIRLLYLGWLYAQGAFWGLVLHGRPSMYTYIPKSLRCFVDRHSFAEMLSACGYRDVRVQSYVLGGIAVHWARRHS
jgi:demethylmenaquinone methyltransferase/2-methoxy-6-polyprenyl-1,4-benzoquinol methylase